MPSGAVWRAYKLSEPMDGHTYVRVSAFNMNTSFNKLLTDANLPGVYNFPEEISLETYIFPCDAEGEITSLVELETSQKGTLDHEKVLFDAGYKIVGLN